eukprot:2817193-Karenia_brevis.AAC.1
MTEDDSGTAGIADESHPEAQELLLEHLMDDAALENDDGPNVSIEDAWLEDDIDDQGASSDSQACINPPLFFLLSSGP